MFYLTHNISAISSGLQLLVSNLESGCDTALVSMTKVIKTLSVIDICTYYHVILCRSLGKT